jgi:DNA-binding MarR family transcriptional regulator
MDVDIREIESLNYVFLRVLGKIFLAPCSNPAANEMTGAQKRTLYLLDLEGPQKMSDIAKLVGVTLPAATPVVDKLVRAGLVAREPDTRDRRVIRVALTARGRKTLKSLKQHHENRLRDVLRELTPAQRTELVSHFSRIHELLSIIDSPKE